MRFRARTPTRTARGTLGARVGDKARRRPLPNSVPRVSRQSHRARDARGSRGGVGLNLTALRFGYAREPQLAPRKESRGLAWGAGPQSAHSREHTQEPILTWKSNRSPPKGSFGFPNQHGDFSILNKPERMLYARTQAGDHGHLRAFAHAGLSVLPMIENMQNNPYWIGNPIGHRNKFTLISKPT